METASPTHRTCTGIGALGFISSVDKLLNFSATSFSHVSIKGVVIFFRDVTWWWKEILEGRGASVLAQRRCQVKGNSPLPPSLLLTFTDLWAGRETHLLPFTAELFLRWQADFQAQKIIIYTLFSTGGSTTMQSNLPTSSSMVMVSINICFPKVKNSGGMLFKFINGKN